MKVFLAGPITGVEDYYSDFDAAETDLTAQGHDVMNPTVLPSSGWQHDAYLRITLTMLEECEAIALLKGWKNSKGAKKELARALKRGMTIIVL